ncbi:RNA methyltransferase [Pusillimonas sp. TS35]|uniref:TrmH family RNA methyltransferase n=1 Tax=Paracandidimonas lactea TaxID=2895524 RepID=UPI00136B2490|nr:RNA methyltransferase [Paracandidimonas lactea]MYN12185.1 RNA methyltransferase [Pusillimonas sp. TS35]
MKFISSRDNAVYKQLLRIAASRHRAGEAPQAMLEGIHLCEAWLQHQGMPVRAVFDAQRLERDEQLQALAEAIDPALCLSCDERLARGLSQVEHGQGVYFVVSPPAPAVPAHIDHLCLWLDRIQDPGNVGTLLRTAAAAGIADVYVSAGTAAVWSPKVLRSAQGAHFALRIREHVDLLAACEHLRVPLLATALEGGVSLYEASLPAHCAWVLGNEGQGVDARLLARADKRVFVPQAPGVESLNVAVAAGICLFEQRRRLLAGTV